MKCIYRETSAEQGRIADLDPSKIKWIQREKYRKYRPYKVPERERERDRIKSLRERETE